MFRILIITEEGKNPNGLHSGLARNGFTCVTASNADEPARRAAEQAHDLVLIEINGHSANPGVWEISRQIKQARRLPVIALVSKETLVNNAADMNIMDDFMVEPYDISELVLRVKRLLHRANHNDTELIKCGDLTIDMAKCEVTVNDRPIELTFREYELLKFLTRNKGLVFNRETLLGRVWGYDYFGGDRTVDVHIRRLRSKVEDSSHSFIETVRNIGYRFRKDR